MPLGDGFYGTESNNQLSREYCKLCFRDGSFINRKETLNTMIEKSINNMVNELSIPENKARELAISFIPKLKRWDPKYEK